MLKVAGFVIGDAGTQGRPVNFERVLRELRKQRQEIERAIAALEAIQKNPAIRLTGSHRRRQRKSISRKVTRAAGAVSNLRDSSKQASVLPFPVTRMRVKTSEKISQNGTDGTKKM